MACVNLVGCYDEEVRLRNQLSEYIDHGLPSHSAEVIVCIDQWIFPIKSVMWVGMTLMLKWFAITTTVTIITNSVSHAKVVIKTYQQLMSMHIMTLLYYGMFTAVGEVYQSYPLIPNS